MSVVQSTYPNEHAALVDGQVADTTTCDIDSLRHTGSDDIPFGRIIRPHTGEQGVQLGIERRQIALAMGAINNSATTLNVDDVAGDELPAGIHILVGSEIMYVSAVAAGALTVVRGALNTAAAAVADNAEVYALDQAVWAGISVQDERLPATSSPVYKTGDVVSGLWRGDVAVRVSAAVARGAPVVAASAASGTGATLETVGQLSAKPVDATHIRIPGAEFIRAAAAQELAVVRLNGPHPA